MKELSKVELYAAAINAQVSQICIVDINGTIAFVNRAWKQFSAENSNGSEVDCIGVNYLNVCGRSVGPASEEAGGFAEGLRSVLKGERDTFELEYPCHSPDAMRWFLASVSALRQEVPNGHGRLVGAVVSHLNITDRKLVELELARLASTDALSEIPNRRFFEDFAKIDMSRFHRFGETSSLLMVDLDRFKIINDTFGHLAGDVAIRRVASIGKAAIRSCDLFARLGGDEFVCLLPKTDLQGAIAVAEKLRRTIEKSLIVYEHQEIALTVSIGAAAMSDRDQSITDVLLRADKALYLAKQKGRNKVSAHFAIDIPN